MGLDPVIHPNAPPDNPVHSLGTFSPKTVPPHISCDLFPGQLPRPSLLRFTAYIYELTLGFGLSHVLPRKYDSSFGKGRLLVPSFIKNPSTKYRDIASRDRC